MGKGGIVKAKFLIVATCANCYLQHHIEIAPGFISRYTPVPFALALQEVESAFLVNLVGTDGWVDGERLLCQRCAKKVEAEKEMADA